MNPEKRNFLGGINSDLSQRLLPDGDCLNIMNSRVSVSEYGRTLRLENVPGTTQITNSVYPPYGTQQTIGSAIQSERQRVLKFIWNSFGYHGIYCYDISSGLTYAVLYDSQVTGGLGFSKSNRIDRNARVSGDILYWTDDNENIRRINIEAGIKMNHPSYVTDVLPYSWPMTQSVIDLLKRPYGLPLIAIKLNDAGFANNFVEEFSGQFASRLIYRDGEYSVMSTPSQMVNYNVSMSSNNYVRVIFPLSETFDQDVQVIQLAVRFNNNPAYFVIKQWDKNNAADLAEINAHNSGSVALTFDFYNNITGIPVGDYHSIKPFDDIPIRCKTLEYAINRLFLANYVKGYDTPSSTSLSATVNTNPSDPAAAQSFKAYSTYKIAIRFRDNGKRSCFAVTNDNCVANIPDRSYSSLAYTYVTWLLSNTSATTEIPEWAIYYDILITKNKRTRFFLQLLANLQYVRKNTDGTYVYESTYNPNQYAIGVDISLLTGTGVGYVANEGDLCRLYLGNTATVFERKVIGQDGDYVLISLADIGSLVTQPGCYFEIYTPYKPLENEPFFTTGNTYLVSNPGTGSRSYSALTGDIAGDVTRFKTSFFGTLRYEFMSPNANQYLNWTSFYGESVVQSNLGQVNKKNFIQWSNIRITGATVNGLSTFDSSDEKGLPAELGDIQKLQLTNKISDLGQGNIMVCIFQTETASLYLGETQVQAAAQAGFVAQATEVIGSVNVLNGSMGTINPESVTPYLGNIYWVDVINGFIVQYSSAGLEPISRYKMARFWKNYAKDYLAASSGNLDNINGFHHIPGGIDPFNKEAFFSLPGLIYQNYAATLPSYSSVPSYATSIINRFDVYDQLAKTMYFKIEDNVWGNNFEAIAEWYEYYENKLFAWKNGVMYSHNTNTTNWNTWYGTEYPVRACVTANFNPSLLKVLNSIAIEGNAIPGFTVGYSDYPNIQITDLTENDYTDQEGQLYATFYKDRLSPNSTGTADEKLYIGDDLTDIVIKVMVEFQAYSSLIYINYINLYYSASRGQKTITNPINT